jgi:hypothetical protein
MDEEGYGYQKGSATVPSRQQMRRYRHHYIDAEASTLFVPSLSCSNPSSPSLPSLHHVSSPLTIHIHPEHGKTTTRNPKKGVSKHHHQPPTNYPQLSITMCQIVETERYILCGHSVPALFKYGLHYCKAPNGIPFTNPESYARRHMYPTRFCDEEKWESLVKKVPALCPDCDKKEKQERRERKARELKLLENEKKKNEKNEKDEKKNEKKKEEETGSGSDSDSSSASSTISTPDEDFYAGVMTIYGCKCDKSIYKAIRLQDCFVRKPLAERNQANASSTVLSPGGTATTTKTFKLPARIEDFEFARSHNHMEGLEFSWEKHGKLRCQQHAGGLFCGNCYRRAVVDEKVDVDRMISKQEETKFGKTKLKKLFVFPGAFARKGQMVAVRGPVPGFKASKGKEELA